MMFNLKSVLSLLIALAPQAALTQTQPVTESQREEMRRRADDLRARNAREREEIQKGFVSIPPSSTSKVTSLDAGKICKATVATVMARSPQIISIESEVAGVVLLSYRRPDDRTQWKNRCKIVGTSVVWASESGRWRDGPHDEKITFQMTSPDQLVIKQRYSDGSTDEKSFFLSKL
ncbi:MAG: hypothetical protein HEQ39_06125 [Rhizobacter sp.]